MNPRQQRFVDEYLIDLNATQAAIRAGYAEKTAYSQGQRLLKDVEIKKYLQESQNKRSIRTQITADYVVSTIHETVERCKQATEVCDARGKVIPGVWTFDAKSVLRGCELLGRHLGIFNDKLDHSGNISIQRTIVHHYKDGERK